MPFVDVAQGDWFQSAVEYVYGNGLFSGMSGRPLQSGDHHEPGHAGDGVYRLAGSPEGAERGRRSFTDVADGSWYAPSCGGAMSRG